MIPLMCLVQQGKISQDIKSELIGELKAFSMRAFNHAADIDWIEVAKGSGFTAAKPSTSIIASMQSDKPLNQSVRELLLKELCDIFMEKTGYSENEIIAAIRDPE